MFGTNETHWKIMVWYILIKANNPNLM